MVVLMAKAGPALEGMALQTVYEGTEAYRPGKMTLTRLSTGKRDTLVDENLVYGPCFSPDGRRIAYTVSGRYIYVMNLDGTGRHKVANLKVDGYPGREPYLTWCTDGYIYWALCTPKIYRVKADGAGWEVYYRTDTAYVQGSNEMVGRNVHNLHVSADGSRAVWTKPPPTKEGGNGWSSSRIDFTTMEEVDFARGCQTVISPEGGLVTRCSSTHRYYHVIPFDDNNPDTWGGCDGEEYQACPHFVRTVEIPDGAKAWLARWPRSASGYICHTLENGNDAVLYDYAADTFHDMGHGIFWDFFPTEIDVDSAPLPGLSLSSAELLFTVSLSGEVSPSEKTVAVINNTGSALGAVSVSGVPAWLKVSTSGSGNEQSLANAIDTAALPEGVAHDATVTVTAPGVSDSATYTVLVNVVDENSPITVFSPGAADVLRIGGEAVVVYTADCVEAPTVTIDLTTDNGKSWSRLHPDAGESCGENVHFTFVVPATTGEGQSTVSEQCRIKVAGYNVPGESQTGLFSIVAADDSVLFPGDAWGRAVSGVRLLNGLSNGPRVRIVREGSYRFEVLGPNGRAVERRRLSSTGIHRLVDRPLPSGRYVVRIFQGAGPSGSALIGVGPR